MKILKVAEKVVKKAIDTSDAPIMVVGANHSGTRGITDVLTQLGSDPGKVLVGPYSENEFFLRLTQEMIQRDSGKGWLDSIYDNKFIEEHVDDLKWVPEIQKRINNVLADNYTDFGTRMWHWKCPSAALYLKTWSEIFPNATVIHIVRDDLDVAESLFRRREVHNPISAVRFNSIFNRRIEEGLGSFSKKITLHYKEVFDRKSEILQLIGLKGLDESEVNKAFERFIIFRRRIWDKTRALKTNIWRLFAKTAIKATGTVFK